MDSKTGSSAGSHELPREKRNKETKAVRSCLSDSRQFIAIPSVYTKYTTTASTHRMPISPLFFVHFYSFILGLVRPAEFDFRKKKT
jgi:hypothetical protein